MRTRKNKVGIQVQGAVRQHSAMAVHGMREVNETRVAVEAVSRMGNGPRIHGIVHEIIFRNRINHNPINLIRGQRAILSNTPMDRKVDVIIRQGGRVIRKIQLKDTRHSIRKTIEQINQGKYSGTEVIGTSETKTAFDAATKGKFVRQPMGSSGISSSDTVRIGSRALRKIPQTQLLVKAAARAAIVGGIFSAGIEALSSYREVKHRAMTRREYVLRIAEEGIGGTVAGGGVTIFASLATAGTPVILSAIGVTAPLWVGYAAGVGVALASGIAVKSAYDRLIKVLRGKRSAILERESIKGTDTPITTIQYPYDFTRYEHSYSYADGMSWQCGVPKVMPVLLRLKIS